MSFAIAKDMSWFDVDLMHILNTANNMTNIDSPRVKKWQEEQGIGYVPEEGVYKLYQWKLRKTFKSYDQIL